MAAVSITAPARAPRWKLSVDAVERMVQAGILPEDAPLELIGGELIEMSPQGPYHSVVCEGIRERLRGALGGEYCVREDKPVVAGRFSLPEPDVALVPGPRARWRDRHPRGDECLLVVEVSLTTQEIDRAKAAVYGTAGVQVYWQVDLESRTLAVYESPTEDGYATRRVLAEGEVVTVPRTTAAVRVSDLLA